MNRNILCCLLLGLSLSFTASAAEQKARGFYIGGSFGVSSLDDDGAFNFLEFDDSDTAYGIFGGYKFFKYLAVEGRYTDFGSFSVSDGFDTENLDISVLSLHAVGIVPFGASGWELFGQLGIGTANIDCDGCSDETVVSAGIGVRFYPTSNLGISLQTDAYVWEEDDFGTTYDIVVVGTQVGIQYAF